MKITLIHFQQRRDVFKLEFKDGHRECSVLISRDAFEKLKAFHGLSQNVELSNQWMSVYS